MTPSNALQLEIKKEAVDRFQNVRNNFAPIIAPIDEPIDATLHLAVGEDFSLFIDFLLLIVFQNPGVWHRHLNKITIQLASLKFYIG